MCVCVKLYENTKKYKYACPGSNKFVYGTYEQESEKKSGFFNMPIRTVLKKSLVHKINDFFYYAFIKPVNL